MVKEEDLLTMDQIAERLGVTKAAVKNWRNREYLQFPEPDVKGANPRATPMWYWVTVKFWALENRPKLL